LSCAEQAIVDTKLLDVSAACLAKAHAYIEQTQVRGARQVKSATADEMVQRDLLHAAPVCELLCFIYFVTLELWLHTQRCPSVADAQCGTRTVWQASRLV
jgi:hypothetical protein